MNTNPGTAPRRYGLDHSLRRALLYGPIALEQDGQSATAILFETWGQTEIGPFRWGDQPHFESRDITGAGCATVGGIPPGESCSFRLLVRAGIFEVYLNDLLVQTYAADGLTGRIGFLVQDGQGTFERPQVWEMALS